MSDYCSYSSTLTSEYGGFTGYVGLIGLLLGIYVFNVYGPKFEYERSIEAAFLVASAAIPMILFEIKIKWGSIMKESTPYSSPDNENFHMLLAQVSISNFLLRFLGMVISFLSVSLIYWNFDEYHASFLYGVFGINEEKRINDDKPYYYNFFRLFGLVSPRILASLSLAYLIVSQIVLNNPHDGYWLTGRFCIVFVNSVIGS